MGWKASLIIIENVDGITDEKSILKAIGKSEYQFEKETVLVDCINPNDNSITIGFYNGNIIISDDYQITTHSLEQTTKLELSKEEKRITELFPKSEIITVACHSSMNYHGYSLINNGEKKRIKIISAETPIIEFGERIEEEIEIYKNSYQKNGINYWKDDYDDEDLTEDQLMEDFTFGVAKRRLGVLIDHSEGEELFENVAFKKYLPSKSQITESEEVKPNKWIKYVIYLIIFLIFRYLSKMIFK